MDLRVQGLRLIFVVRFFVCLLLLVFSLVFAACVVWYDKGQTTTSYTPLIGLQDTSAYQLSVLSYCPNFTATLDASCFSGAGELSSAVLGHPKIKDNLKYKKQLVYRETAILTGERLSARPFTDTLQAWFISPLAPQPAYTACDEEISLSS